MVTLAPFSVIGTFLAQERRKMNRVLPEMIRLSVGREDIEDLLWDLDQALR